MPNTIGFKLAVGKEVTLPHVLANISAKLFFFFLIKKCSHKQGKKRNPHRNIEYESWKGLSISARPIY